MGSFAEWVRGIVDLVKLCLSFETHRQIRKLDTLLPLGSCGEARLRIQGALQSRCDEHLCSTSTSRHIIEHLKTFMYCLYVLHMGDKSKA